MTLSEFPTRACVAVLCLLTFSFTPLSAQMQGGGNSEPARIGGMFPTNPTDGESLRRLTPYVTLMGTYTFDAPVTTGTSGEIRQANTDGLMANLALDGYQSWRRSQLGVGFHGSYRKQFNNSVKDSDTESLILGFEHRISERTTLSLSETATSANRAISTSNLGIGAAGLLPGLGNFDPGLSSAPSAELLDQRVYFSSTSGQIGYQQTARLGWFAGGGGFALRRGNGTTGLPGVIGASAVAGTRYALSRRQSISVQYSLIHYGFSNNYGNANTNMAAVGYGIQMNRNWTLELQGGSMRISESRPVRNVLDPVTAAILGQSFTVERYNGSMFTWLGGAGLSGTFRRSSVSMNYRRNISAGNGVYLASRQDNAIGVYSYQLMRRVTAKLGANYIRQASVSQNYRALEQVSAHAGVAYRLSDSFFLNGTVTARHMLSSVLSSYNPEAVIAAIGIGYSPTRGLPVW